MTTEAELGRQLVLLEQERRTRPPLSEGLPDLSIASAYAIQSAYAMERERQGARRVGVKIGCTSAAIQDYFGVYEPDFGVLFDQMRRDSGDTVALGSLIQARAEPELAIIIGSELRGPGLTVDDLRGIDLSVAPSLEIVDSRIDDWRITIVDTIADNGSSSLFVVGDSRPLSELPPLETIEVRFGRAGGEEIVESGTAVMGGSGPLAAVAWLANRLGEFGATIPAGSIILSGSFTTAVPCRAGDRFEAEFTGGLGRVSLAFE